MGWSSQPLGALCDVLDSKRKPITKRDRKPGNIPYYGATGIVDHVDDFIFDEPIILIGEDGAKWEAGDNTAFMVNGKCWVNNHAHVIRPNRDLTLDKWITYQLNAADLTPFITGLTVPKLNQGKLKEIPIPLPPLPEQRRIVAILDEAFEGIDKAIANTEQNLTNARELFEGHLNDVFSQNGDGWSETTLREISLISYGYTAKASNDAIGPRFLRITDIQNDSVNWADVPFCPISQDDLEKHRLTDGDVVFARTGATTGKSYLVSDPPESVAASYLIRLRPDQRHMLPEFVAKFFQTNIYWRLVAQGTSGSAQGGFNATKLSNMRVPLPALPEQRRIVAILDALSTETLRLESIYQQKLGALAELKQSILRKAFNGELTAHEAAA